MTASTIISIVLALLRLANSLYGWLHDSALIKEGEDRQIAKALAAMARRSAVIKQAASTVDKMTDKQVLDALDKSGDLRD